jgi:hypothetical protein
MTKETRGRRSCPVYFVRPRDSSVIVQNRFRQTPPRYRCLALNCSQRRSAKGCQSFYASFKNTSHSTFGRNSRIGHDNAFNLCYRGDRSSAGGHNSGLRRRRSGNARWRRGNARWRPERRPVQADRPTVQPAERGPRQRAANEQCRAIAGVQQHRATERLAGRQHPIGLEPRPENRLERRGPAAREEQTLIGKTRLRLPLSRAAARGAKRVNASGEAGRFATLASRADRVLIE